MKTTAQVLRDHALYGDLNKHPDLPRGFDGKDSLTSVLGKDEWLLDMSKEEYGVFCLLVAESLENPC